MKAYTLAILVTVASGSGVFAGTVAPTSNTRGLHEADASLTARANTTTKSGHQARLLLQRERVRSLIGDIESGKSVDPNAIDRALLDAQQP